MARCGQCNATIQGNVNFWHNTVVPTNPNQKLDIKFPVSWGSEMIPFCKASCLSEYIRNYSGHSETSSAKVQGTPQTTCVKTILNEPFRQDTKSKQTLDKEGFKRLENDKNKGDLRSEVGLSAQEQSQQIIYKKLNNLKEKQNNMESTSKTITQCDNCKKSLEKDEKGQSIKATLDDAHTKKTAGYHYCDEECLRQHLNSRAKRKKSKASLDVLEIDMSVK